MRRPGGSARPAWRSSDSPAGGHESSFGDPGIAQKRPNLRSESTWDNFRSGSDRRLKSLGFSTEPVIKTPDPLGSRRPNSGALDGHGVGQPGELHVHRQRECRRCKHPGRVDVEVATAERVDRQRSRRVRLKGCRLIAVRSAGGRSAPTFEHEHEHEPVDERGGVASPRLRRVEWRPDPALRGRRLRYSRLSTRDHTRGRRRLIDSL